MTAVLVIALAVALWAGFVYVSPFGRCGRCRGKGVITRRDRPVRCPRCHGQRRWQRRGSRTVHRTVRMVRAERQRTRRERS
jgi:DnaJ-class molecular chaperone